MDELVAAAQEEGELNVIALPPDWTNYAEVISTFEETFDLREDLTRQVRTSLEALKARIEQLEHALGPGQCADYARRGAAARRSGSGSKSRSRSVARLRTRTFRSPLPRRPMSSPPMSASCPTFRLTI